MDVIGNNIANVNTTGFKSSRVTFNEIFYQTLQGGTAASKDGQGGRNPMQIGLGVNVASIDLQMTEGAAQRTDNALDLKIEGEGFFIVTDGNGKKFTRDGSFRLDEAGNLVTSSGMKVCGWPVNNSTGQIVKGPVQPLEIMSSIMSSVAPQKTTGLTFQGNLNLVDGDSSGTGIPLMMNFYDSLGNKYTAQATTMFDTVANPGVWSITQFDYIKDENGNEVEFGGNPVAGAVLTAPITFGFDANGNLENINGVAGSTTIDVDFSGVLPFDGINSEIGDANVITLDFEEVTQYNSTTTITSDNDDGNAPGQFTGFNVGADGKILAKYSNGDTKILGQIVVTTFKNPTGLLKVGGNLFETSANSGEFDGVGVEPTFVGGLNSGVLEMSNVDLSKEFTEMITTQRGFQANSRIITTSDEMLQELTNLKR